MRTAKEWVDLVIADITGEMSIFELYDITDSNQIYCDGDLIGEIAYIIKYQPDRNKLSLSNFTIEQIEQFGGEGKGDEYWYIYKITELNSGEYCYIKYEGYYNSWNGTTWIDECYFVKPVEKTIVVYEVA